jgi:hypothetical protein
LKSSTPKIKSRLRLRIQQCLSNFP